jgi:hypothetical protein
MAQLNCWALVSLVSNETQFSKIQQLYPFPTSTIMVNWSACTLENLFNELETAESIGDEVKAETIRRAIDDRVAPL